MKILISREQILPFVREWIELLIQDNYEKAVEVLYSSSEEVWNPQFLRHVVANYGTSKTRSDGKVFRVTPIASATLASHQTTILEDVEWFGAEGGKQLPEHVLLLLLNEAARSDSSALNHVGLVFYSLPVNGDWSDLTAIFWINAFNENYMLQLENVSLHLGDMHFL